MPRIVTDHADLIETVARAICAERCAFYGDPPCHELDEWHEGMDCGDPEAMQHDVGCRALAKAAVSAMPLAALLREAAKALGGE